LEDGGGGQTNRETAGRSGLKVCGVAAAYRVRCEGNVRELAPPVSNTAWVDGHQTSKKRNESVEGCRLPKRHQGGAASPAQGRRLRTAVPCVTVRDLRTPWCPRHKPSPTGRIRNGNKARVQVWRTSCRQGGAQRLWPTAGSWLRSSSAEDPEIERYRSPQGDYRSRTWVFPYDFLSRV